jgi:colicin import membrane protein
MASQVRNVAGVFRRHDGCNRSSTMTTTMTKDTPDTSVMFSLDELARLEQDRIREEERERARERLDRVRREREEQERLRAVEAARIATEAEERARREREAAAERAVVEARKQAELDVARIHAEAAVKLEAENATRAHELAVIRASTDKSRTRMRHALAVIVGLVICGGSAAAYAVSDRVASLEDETRRIGTAQRLVEEERGQSMAAELAALDKRHEALRASDSESAEALAAASARRALDGDIESRDLLAFAAALDALQTRIAERDRATQLEKRHADLAAWAAREKRGDLVARADRARGAKDLDAWESALDAVSTALGGAAPVAVAQHRGTQQTKTTVTETPATSGVCKREGDPMCGLDGETLKTR